MHTKQTLHNPKLTVATSAYLNKPLLTQAERECYLRSRRTFAQAQKPDQDIGTLPIIRAIHKSPVFSFNR